MNSRSQLPLCSLTRVSLLSGANAPRWFWLVLSWDTDPLPDPKRDWPTGSKRYLTSLRLQFRP